MNIKGSFMGNNLNANLKVKGVSDIENSDYDIDYSDSNIEQQNKQFYDKIEQANNMGKSVLNNPSNFMKSGVDSFKNGLDKQIQREQQNDLNNGMKQTVKGLDNAVSSSFGFGKNPLKTIKGLENASQNMGVDLNVSNNISDMSNGLKNSMIKQTDALGQNAMSSYKQTIKQGENYMYDGENAINNGISNMQNDLNANLKNSFKGPSNFLSKANDKIKSTEDQMSNIGMNKISGQYISDINKNVNSIANNSMNDMTKQMGSLNPFVSKNDINVMSNISGGFEKQQNGINSIINRNNNSYISKQLEGEVTLDQTIDPSLRSQMHKQRPDPVHTNQSDMIIAAKQNKGVFQQTIIQNNLQKVNNGSNLNNSQVIQIYDENTDKGDKGAKIMKAVPWMLLAIIGMWTFVFMVSDIIDFSSWKFISENSLINVAGWYSTNKPMQEAALGYSGGIGRNYISLIDFILFFFITKVFYNIWLTNDYLQPGNLKNNLMSFLFLKDIIVIILSLSSGDYDSASGWDGFGYFWLKTLGKLSIILSFSKIFFFRLNYFKTFTDAKDGCSGMLRNWGIMLYQWASQNNRNPEFSISVLLFSIYTPLVLHCIVGVIESTYILIIWIAILFFLQQILSLLFELCKPRQEDKTLVQRLMEKQKSGITEQIDKFWVYFTLLYVIIPGVASVSFGSNFKESIKFHFTGQQLIFSFFSIPASGSSYSNTMTFLCNILSLF